MQKDIEKKPRTEVIHVKTESIEKKSPTLYDNDKDSHPKTFLKYMDNFMNHKKIPSEDNVSNQELLKR